MIGDVFNVVVYYVGVYVYECVWKRVVYEFFFDFNSFGDNFANGFFVRFVV